MADTAIAITAGSGTNVDTRTEATNGNHRQVIVIGDPSTNAGVAPVDATNGLKVDAATVVTSLTDGSQHTVIVDGTDTEVTFEPSVAHDSADSGNPTKIGAKATTSLSGLTLVADGDRTDVFAGLDGVLIVRPHCNLEGIVSGVAAITDGSSTSVIASSGAGVRTYITTCIIANTSATAVTVDLRDGAAGTVMATLPVPANTSGIVVNLPIPLKGSAATAWCADPSTAASTITVTLIGFKSKV